MKLLMKTFGATVLAAAMISGCASQREVVNVQRDMDELKTRILKTERDLSAIRSETKEGIDQSLKASQKDLDDVRKGGADLQAALEGVKVDMQVLTGKLDDVSLLAKKPADDLSLLKEDLERRFSSLDERFRKLSLELDEVKKGLAEMKAREAELARKPENLMQTATDLLQKGETGPAREKLQKLLEANPKDPKMAEARYLLGETYYQEKKFEQAILEYQEVIKSFAGSDKIPAALLKQAMAFQELKDPKSARYVYKKLADDFAATEEGKTAKEKLKEVK